MDICGLNPYNPIIILLSNLNPPKFIIGKYSSSSPTFWYKYQVNRYITHGVISNSILHP